MKKEKLFMNEKTPSFIDFQIGNFLLYSKHLKEAKRIEETHHKLKPKNAGFFHDCFGGSSELDGMLRRGAPQKVSPQVWSE